MARGKYVVLILIIGLFAIGPAVYLWAAITQTMDTGDPVHFTAPGELDVPVLRMNGSIVGSSAPVIVTVRANQALGATTVIQHASRNDAIEFVQISSTGGAITSTASPLRIAAGVSGQIIVLQGTSATATYTIPDGNGVKLASATALTFDDRTSMSFRYDTTGGTWRQMVTIAGGGGGGGTAASISFSPTGGIAAATVQTALAEVDSEAEKVANKNANSGYLGLNSTGDATWDHKDSYATQTPDLSASSQIDAATLQVTTIGIQNAGAGNVTLSGGTPRITGCTTATGGTGRNGTRLVIRGLHPTKTVTIPTGQGIQLAGNTGSVIVGSLLSPVEFQCDETNQLWVQSLVPSAQQVYNVGRTVSIFACGNALNPIWDGGGGTTMEFCLDAGGSPTWKALVAGSSTDSIVQLASGKKFCVLKSDLTTQLFCVNDSGAVSGLSAQQAITGNHINANATCTTGGGVIHWYALNGRSGGNTADGYNVGRVQQPWPIAQTLTRLRVQHDGSVVAFTSGVIATYTIYRNGVVASGMSSCAVTSAATPCTVTGSISVAQNDLMALQMVCSGANGTAGDAAWGIAAQ